MYISLKLLGFPEIIQMMKLPGVSQANDKWQLLITETQLSVSAKWFIPASRKEQRAGKALQWRERTALEGSNLLQRMKSHRFAGEWDYTLVSLNYHAL